MDQNLIQMVIMAMDVAGWEQDGDGLAFIHVSGNGERRKFKNWTAVYNFAVSLK